MSDQPPDDPEGDEGWIDAMRWWRPFPTEAYSSTCDLCPHRGWDNVFQRAFIRLVMLTGQHPWLLRGPMWLRWVTTICVGIITVSLELIFQCFSSIWGARMRFLLFCGFVAALVGPPFFLWFNPGQYTPVAETSLNVLLAVLSGWLTYFVTVDTERTAANDRWVPQAESACRNLLTVRTAITVFREGFAMLCTNAEQQIPSLTKPGNAELRAVLHTRCSTGADQLQLIENSLDNAAAEWERFLEYNCNGGDCDRIKTVINEQRQLLGLQIAEVRKRSASCLPDAACDSAIQPTPST